MKRYTLKKIHIDHVKKLCGLTLKFGKLPLSHWKMLGYNIEALEEVEERIELYSRPRCEGRLDNGHTKIIVGLQKVSGEIFTDQEKELCEKALNGELFTKEDLYQFAQKCLSECEGEYFSPDLLDSVFKHLNKKK